MAIASTTRMLEHGLDKADAAGTYACAGCTAPGQRECRRGHGRSGRSQASQCHARGWHRRLPVGQRSTPNAGRGDGPARSGPSRIRTSRERSARSTGRAVIRHDGAALLRRQVAQHRQHLLAVRDVEVAGGLVRQQHLRLVRERAAIATRCCSPPESWLGRWAARPESPTESSSTSASERRRAVASPVGASAASTFSRAVSVGIRLNCWNTNPNVSKPQRASARRRPAATGRGLRTAARRSSGGRARRAAGAAWSCPSRSAPRRRGTRRRATRRSTSLRRETSSAPCRNERSHAA